MTTPEPGDPRTLRISDADRHRVAEVLREAAGEGRLDIDELEERLEGAWAARTYGDLVPLTADLPGHRDLAPPAVAPARRASPATPAHREVPVPEHAPRHDRSLAVLSETRRDGVWVVEPEHVATTVMGSVVLDLREAHLVAPVTRIEANAVMGSVEVIVDVGTDVRVDGTGVMGTFAQTRRSLPLEPPDDGSPAPLVVVTGFALMGSVEVKRKGPRRRLLDRRRSG